MLHVGLDLSRNRLDVCAIDSSSGELIETAVGPDSSGLEALASRLAERGPVRAAIESMNGARFVHDELERQGWEVAIADAHKTKGIAPLACKTDRVDARVLATLSLRDLVPEIWLPDPHVREERERARFRLHLVKHRSSLKQRISATLMTFGIRKSRSDMFGPGGREVLAGSYRLPKPWRGNVDASLFLIDQLDAQIAAIERELRQAGVSHRYVGLLTTVPGIAWILGYTIAAEIGDIERFPSPTKLCGYTGLCPRVYQSGERDRRGGLAKAGPRYLRWALIEASQHAARSPYYQALYERQIERLGRDRGSKIARITVARKLANAIWHMLTKNERFAPGGATLRLAA